MHVWIKYNKGDPLGEKFLRIQDYLEVMAVERMTQPALTELAALCEKYSILISDADSLSPPLRAIAKFVKKEVEIN